MAKKSAVYNDYTINVEDNGSITVYKSNELCSVSVVALREIADQCGFTIEEKWNVRQIGSKLIDFLNGNQTVAKKTVKNGNTMVSDFIVAPNPNRPVYVLEIYPVPQDRFESYKSVEDADKLGALMEELSYYAKEKGCSNKIVLMDCSDSYPTPIVALQRVVDPETNEVLFETNIKMNESWIPKISSDLNDEEKKSLQRVRQTIENSYLSANNPMGEALVETLNNIRKKDNLTFLPSLLKSICKKEDKEQNANTPYIIGLAEYPQVVLRYRFEVDGGKFTGCLNPAFWRLDEPGLKLPSLSEMSLDKFTTGNYYMLNVLEEKEADVICTCSKVYYDEMSIKKSKYCFVNNKLEEIGISKEVTDSIESAKAEALAKEKEKEYKKNAIVRVNTGILYKRSFEDPDEGDEYVMFSYPADTDNEFEVERNGKVSTYTFDDLFLPEDKGELPFSEILAESEDETGSKCLAQGWDEIDCVTYDDETVEYAIPLNDDEEFDPTKLQFVYSEDDENFDDYPIDPWCVYYDGKEIEESSGVIEAYL